MTTTSRLWVVAVLCCLATSAFSAEAPLTSLDLTKIRQGYGKPEIDKSIRGTSLTIAKRVFEHGLGTHADSSLWVQLDGKADRFHAFVGLDDAANGPGRVNFKVYADGHSLYESGPMKPKQAAKEIDVPLAGVKMLLLKVTATDATDFCHADWADAKFTFSGEKPVATDAPREEDAVILTPKPAPAPRINAPKVYGCRPGNPFLFKIPAQGERPMSFKADDLPQGLTLDENSGFISGTAPARGEYKVTLRAKNSKGDASRPFKIVSGDTLSLTPYMGWNHWYAHYHRITDPMMREAADIMTTSGMADVGYSYVSIDDCWMNAPEGSKNKDPKRVGPVRDENGNIKPNSFFPDMKGLTEYIHAKGLKAGIYTSPGCTTCGGYGAAYEHEAQDAKQFADWGFDLLKYDWCSYGKIAPNPNLEQMQKPYKLMGKLLKEQKRDVIYNLCQYGMGNVWEWGKDVDAQSWRTAGDLGVELNRLFTVARNNAVHRAFNGPGTWNDPDYVQIGWIGNAHGGGMPGPCPYTPTEQYAFMSLWCLSAAPLMYSGDMTKLDEFTLNVLCNPEVIEINQDVLGQCGAVLPLADDAFIMVKDLEDGSKAVGLCNGGEMKAELSATWAALGLSGKQRVRDPWRQKDLGTLDGELKSTVGRHGVALFRLSKAD